VECKLTFRRKVLVIVIVIVIVKMIRDPRSRIRKKFIPDQYSGSRGKKAPDKTTKLILLDSLLKEIGDACLPPPPCEVDQADTFR
jgi:hypothetical protein